MRSKKLACVDWSEGDRVMNVNLDLIAYSYIMPLGRHKGLMIIGINGDTLTLSEESTQVMNELLN